MTGWQQVPFESIYAEPSRNGIYKSSEHHGTGAKIVNMGELFAHEFVGPQEMSRLAMTDQELEKSGLADGDLLFGRRSLVESGAGKCSLVVGISEPTTFESSIIRVRLDEERAVPLFYYYWLRSPAGRGRIRAIVSGTNVKGIRGSDLRNVPVPLPDQGEQANVAALLRTYDDLIENNRRRIQLLEESARLLYREWFDHLRFPGHEHVRVVDGVPEGWSRRTYSDVCEAIGGGTPSSAVSEYWEGDITWVTPSDITANDSLYLLDSSRKITEAGLKNSSAKMLPADAILMTSRASIGFFALANRPVCTNQGFITVVPKLDCSRYFLLFEMMSRVEEFRSRASGSTFKELSKGVFRELSVLWPGQALLAEHAIIIEPIIDQIQTLATMNSKLRVARDLLLPRLMSGELPV